MQHAQPPAYLQSTLAEVKAKWDDLYWEQYQRLQEAEEASDPISPFSRLIGPEIVRRNRYGNIDPFLWNRIKLRVPDAHLDYINASRILLTGTKSGRARTYIATQGPKQTTLSHLWQMAWHESGEEVVIVMLTQTYEAGREKCFQYFPIGLDNKTLDISEQSETSGNFLARVELLESTSVEQMGSTLRKLKLHVGQESKVVWHYLFERWPDFSIPTGNDKQALLELIKHVRTRVENGSGPPIVHCSAGVGRSGTFIALDYLITELNDGALDVSRGDEDDRVAQTVDELRKQRVWMVQQEEQFAFLYEIMKEQWLQKYNGRNAGG